MVKEKGEGQNKASFSILIWWKNLKGAENKLTNNLSFLKENQSQNFHNLSQSMDLYWLTTCNYILKKYIPLNSRIHFDL
jgi:hypothetical protein